MPQKEPVTVAYLLPNLERGGTEKHVLDLVAGIDRRRFRPCVIGTLGGGPLADDFRRIKVPVHVLEYRGLSRNPANAGRYLHAAWRFFRDLARILGERQVRIAHAYLPSANVLGMVGASVARVPVRIVSKRGLCRYKYGHPIFSFFENLANGAADAVMVNSLAVAEAVKRSERFLGSKIFLVHNGVDPDAPAPAPIGALCPEVPGREGDPVVTYVANLFPYKGHRDLVAAAAVVVGEFSTVRFLLVGRDAGEMAAVRRQVSSLGLERHVFLAGEHPEAFRLIASSTLVVHPSHEEGFSNTILEAMAAGKAVVATRVGGIPEAVIDGETGLLVPPHDPPALAAALLSLLRDTDRARAMGEAGRRRVAERFSIGRMVTTMEQTYLELLEGRPLSCRL